MIGIMIHSRDSQWKYEVYGIQIKLGIVWNPMQLYKEWTTTMTKSVKNPRYGAKVIESMHVICVY